VPVPGYTVNCREFVTETGTLELVVANILTLYIPLRRVVPIATKHPTFWIGWKLQYPRFQ